MLTSGTIDFTPASQFDVDDVDGSSYEDKHKSDYVHTADLQYNVNLHVT